MSLLESTHYIIFWTVVIAFVVGRWDMITMVDDLIVIHLHCATLFAFALVYATSHAIIPILLFTIIFPPNA